MNGSNSPSAPGAPDAPDGPTVAPEPATSALEPLALRAPDAARTLGISERALWSLTRTGSIPHVRLGRSVTYPVAQLREWLRRRATGGK